MGQGPSQEADPAPQYGYHVVKVHASSPGSAAGLQTHFDFITHVNGALVEEDEAWFARVMEQYDGRQLPLTVYNSLAGTQRQLSLVPRSDWGGNGRLGVRIRHCDIHQVVGAVWHVTDVAPDSPASAAGLKANTDFVLGSPDIILTECEDLFNLVATRIGHPVPLLVYNSANHAIRSTNIVPTVNWAGPDTNGCLGCEFGFGFIHRIPRPALAEGQMVAPAPSTVNLSESPAHSGSQSTATTSPARTPATPVSQSTTSAAASPTHPPSTVASQPQSPPATVEPVSTPAPTTTDAAAVADAVASTTPSEASPSPEQPPASPVKPELGEDGMMAIPLDSPQAPGRTIASSTPTTPVSKQGAVSTPSASAPSTPGASNALADQKAKFAALQARIAAMKQKAKQ